MARKKGRGRNGEILEEGIVYRPEQDNYGYYYTDPNGDRIWECYNKDLEVVREARQKVIKAGYDGLDYYSKGKANVNVLIEQYLSTKVELKKTVLPNYYYTYQHYIKDGFGKRRIKEVGYTEVLRYYQYLLYSKELDISVVDSVNNILSPAFQMAVRDRIRIDNPVTGVLSEIKKKGRGRFKRKIRHPLTVEEQKIFQRQLKRPENLNWAPVFTLFLETGLRPGEGIGLTWNDVDMEAHTVNVNHELQYYNEVLPSGKKGKGKYGIFPPKSEAGNRTIHMTKALCEALKQRKKLDEASGIICRKELQGQKDFIFCNRDGGFLSEHSLNTKLHRIQKTYNREELLQSKREGREPVLLPEFSCYNLRHTFCSRLCENETNIKAIQTVMGHQDVQTTLNIYAEVTESAQKSFMEGFSEKMEAIFKDEDEMKDASSVDGGDVKAEDQNEGD